MGQSFLETERLLLRPITNSDVDNLLWMFSDPDTMKFMEKLLNREDTLKWIAWNFKHHEENGFGYLAIELNDSQTFIGRVGLVASTIEDERKVEMGWFVHSEYWNKGYATEATKALLNYAFDNYGLDTVYATLNPKNTASVRITEKIGMTLLRKVLYKGTPETPLFAIHRPN